MHNARVFHAHAHPNVGCPIQGRRQFYETSTPLGEDLEGMPRTLTHGQKDLLDKGQRHVVVKQVTHRVHKDYAGRLPRSWSIDQIIVRGTRETVRVAWGSHGVESLCHSFRIAVLAAGAHLRASGHG